MLFKAFKPVSSAQATILLTAATFISYAIGLLRDRVIAVHFGTTSAADAYNASFLIPDFLFNLFIAGALSAAFLPVFSDYLIKDKREAFKIANIMLSTSVMIIGIFALISFIFMPQIIPLIFKNIDHSMQKDIIGMTRLMLTSAIFFAISNTIGNILMSYKHFLSYAISPILYNLGIVFGVIFLQEKFGIYSAAIGVLIGGVMHCTIRILDLLKTDYRFKIQWEIKHPAFKKIVKLMIPRSIGLIFWQLNSYIYAFIGIKLIEGSFAAFNFARNIQSFAVNLFGIAISTAIFPYLANTVSNNDPENFTESIQKTMEKILFFTIPSAIALLILSGEVVELILSGGAFDQNSIKLTSLMLFFFAISIPFESLSHILARAFYAHQNTITPTIINVASMTIMALATIYFAPKYGVHWFSTGFTIGFLFYVIVSLCFLRKHLKNFKIKVFLTNLAKTAISTIFMAAVLLISKNLELIMANRLSDLTRIFLGAIAFFLVAKLLKSPELNSLKTLLLKKDRNSVVP